MKISPDFEAEFPDLFRAGYRAALAITGSPGMSEDVAAEALYRASIRWARVRATAVPWVVRVSSNLALDELRRELTRRRLGPALLDESPDVGADVAQRLDLLRALDHLPERQRQVVLLRYFGELSEREVAAALGIAPGTAKSHASRGLEALRVELRGPSVLPCSISTSQQRGAKHE